MIRSLVISTAILVTCCLVHAPSPEAAETAAALQVAGNLTCVTDPAASLVFGRAPVGRCTLAQTGGSESHAYMAMFEPVPAGRPMPGEEVLAWEVHAPAGKLRHGALDGGFSVVDRDLEASDAAEIPTSLVPMTDAARRGVAFVAIAPRTTLTSGL